MGKILDYNNLGAAPADNDLLFMGDYSADASNPTTMRLTISDLNKKRNVDAADSNGLKLRDDSGTYGIFIKDGGNVGIGTNSPDYKLDLETAAVGTSNLRIFSNIANGYPHLVMKNDVATWSIYAPHGGFAGPDTADLFSIYNGSSHVLIIQTDGNVGIGVDPNIAAVSYQLEVVGKLAATGTNNVIIDGATGEVKSQGGLHLEKSAAQDVYVVGDSSAAAIYAKSSNKKVGINYISSPEARLHIYEDASGTATNLKLETYQGTGTVRTIQQFTQTVGASSLHHYLVWDGVSLGINSDGLALGADSVNFTGGKIGINAAVGNRVLEATQTSGTSGIVGAMQAAASGQGPKLLFRNTVDATSADQSQGLGFTTTVSSAENMTWFAGAFRPSGASSTHYFALNYTGSAASGGDGIYKINSTLALNAMYLDESGNVTFKGNVRGNGFFDKGSATTLVDAGVGNYCRGRFVQTFSVPYYADVNNRFSPLLASPFDRTDDTAGSTITAKWVSIAPHDGRIQSVRAAAKNNASAQTNMTIYVYTGSSLPTGTELSSTDSAYMQGYDGGGATANTQLQVASLANAKITLGYSDFGGVSAGGQSNLDFSQGDYLMFSFDCDSGNANLNVDFTCEFYIDDTL